MTSRQEDQPIKKTAFNRSLNHLFLALHHKILNTDPNDGSATPTPAVTASLNRMISADLQKVAESHFFVSFPEAGLQGLLTEMRNFVTSYGEYGGTESDERDMLDSMVEGIYLYKGYESQYIRVRFRSAIRSNHKEYHST